MSEYARHSDEVHTIAVLNVSSNDVLLRRLQPDVRYIGYISDQIGHMPATPSSQPTPVPFPLPAASSMSTTTILSKFVPTSTTPASLSYAAGQMTTTSVGRTATATTTVFSTQSPPSIANLVASSTEDLSNFRDVTFDIFDDDDDLFDSPLAFDGSENGLWSGRFVPPPPRPPFLVEDAMLSDGLTTCDLCSWAMPTKSTFIFEGTIEKASELGWPLTLIIVSIVSALFGAIIMVGVVRSRRKEPSNNRNAAHVQCWSRNKRPTRNNNNNSRRSNIYTAHPADSIRGMQQSSMSAASSLTTAITAIGGTNAPNSATTIGTAPSMSQHHHHLHQHEQDSEQQYKMRNCILQPHHHGHRAHAAANFMHDRYHDMHHHHRRQHHRHNPHPPQFFFQQQQPQRDYNVFDHEYRQPHDVHINHRRLSPPPSTSSASSPSRSLTLTPSALMPIVQHVQLQQQQQPPKQRGQQCIHDDANEAAAAAITTTPCQWPNTAMILAS